MMKKVVIDMGSPKRFAAINTKVMGMEGNLLYKEDYTSLLKLSTLDECIGYLKENTSYGEIIDAYEGNLTLESLEGLFKQNVYRKLEKIKLYFVDDYREFISGMFVRYEVENIKLFLRTLLRDEKIIGLSEHLFKPKLKSKLDYKNLENVSSMEELIEMLKDTPYKRILELYLDEPPTKKMFYMEMSLDRYYFMNLMKKVKKLDNEDRILLEELLGSNIDLLNIQWIYRGKKYYDLSSEELINYTLTGGYKFKYKDLKKLCYISELDEIIEEIKNSKYAELVKGEKDADVYVEVEMERYLHNKFKRFRSENHMNIIEPLVFIHSLEYEMRDLFIILESKRYGIGEEIAKTFLVKMT